MTSSRAKAEAAAPTVAQCQAAAETCACFNVRRTARLVTQVYDDALGAVKVSSGQFVILLTMRILNQPTMQQLAEAVSLDRSALSRALKPLVDRKFLQVRVGNNRRRREVELTTEGLKLLADGTPHWARAQARMEAALGVNAFNGLIEVSKSSYLERVLFTLILEGGRKAYFLSGFPAPFQNLGQ
ncbi:MAG: winged helix-turn-helix transcriptional regulator [Candidatus Synoicihabitans palmerolidicus]|nr:winged helix-turn-helix transcriptional regulator [Candidatus Synoicihabitans palmerolidicus]